ncbi:MAG: glycosyltransferase family 4 protein, partial [Candidatus Limnocylindria bacterium]
MRFLILTQYYPPEIGAAQARLSAFAGQLQRAGHEVEVVTALPNYPGGKLDEADRRLLGRREVLNGVPVRRTWLLTATGVGARRLASYLSFAATGLVSALVAGRPDVVFVESPPLFLGVSGWMAARRAGAAFVLNVSDLWPDSVRDLGVLSDGPALRAAERLERWLYARATAVTAVTEGIREALVERKGVPAHKALFLPNGVDLDQFRPTDPDPEVRTRHGLPEGPLVLFTGNHGYAQALETVIGAAELVPEVTIALVGAGSDKARIQELARERGTANVR